MRFCLGWAVGIDGLRGGGLVVVVVVVGDGSHHRYRHTLIRMKIVGLQLPLLLHGATTPAQPVGA